MTVPLKEIVDALEMQFDESSSFLDLNTGKVETVSDDLLRRADDSADVQTELPAWQEREWEIAKEIVSTDRFRQLPTKFDVHEWAIMRDFSFSVPSETIREDLLNAIHGTGAFRHFNNALRRHGVESAWFTFRTEALIQIARAWCEEHRIEWQ
jgi:Uncharacterised protein family (UPF0158)